MKEKDNTYRIADMAESERPRERLSKYGTQVLTNAELMAILLRVGVPGENAVELGRRLLDTFGGISGLHRAAFDVVCDEHGMGPAKTAQIKAALELGHRMAEESQDEIPAVHSPEDAANLVMHRMSALEQEELHVILLDTRNRVMGVDQVYRGSVNSSQVHVGELFKTAIRRNIPAVIVVHNHPSGDPEPSPDDVAVTRAFVEAGKLLDIKVLDHLVIGNGRFVSLKERRLGF
jgi:DNA repair protein RadC